MIRSKRVAGLVATGALLAGCGEQAPLNPVNQAVHRSLEEYGRVIQAKRRAVILLGNCLAWKNPDMKSVTVVLNPGIVDTATSKGDTVAYPVYAAPSNTGNLLDLELKPGPITVTPASATSSYVNKDSGIISVEFDPLAGGERGLRQLSTGLTEDSADLRYFTDAKSGQPVMESVVSTASFTGVNVARTCLKLLAQSPSAPAASDMLTQTTI